MEDLVVAVRRGDYRIRKSEDRYNLTSALKVLEEGLRAMHARPTHAWTVAELAKEAALSRSTFFERFNRTVGVAPMEYLLRWRMALAKDLLRRAEGRIAEVALRVGYSSASTFSVAFTRHVGQSPSQYARGGRER